MCIFIILKLNTNIPVFIYSLNWEIVFCFVSYGYIKIVIFINRTPTQILNEIMKTYSVDMVNAWFVAWVRNESRRN